MDSSKFETQVGIEEYLRDHPGFFGIIKQRFSDFLVNEISLNQKIIQLSNKDVIEPPQKENSIDNIVCPKELQARELEILKVLAGLKQVKEIKPSVFYDSVKGCQIPIEEKYTELLIDVNGLSKEARTEIHKYVKSEFKNLNSSTTTKTTHDSEEKKYIRVTKNANAKPSDRKRNEWTTPECHVHFVLYKEFIGTMEAIGLIARKLRLNNNLFSYAGTKDKRAKTSQEVSVYKVKPERLMSVAKSLKGIHIGNFSFSPKPKRLGDLWGNRFKIVLREVKDKDEDIHLAVNHLKETGFINYFGLQRFGSVNATTHLIGKAMLLSQWKQAVDLILAPCKMDSRELSEAKAVYRKNKDASAALNCLRHSKYSNEGCVLSGLVSYGSNNYLGAIEKVPRNMKLMYLHAYQSFVWNKVVSRRIKKYGLKVLKGDIIRAAKIDATLDSLSNEDLVDEDSLSVEEEDSSKGDVGRNSKFTFISTEEDVKNYSIDQIYMPLPGHNVIYPDNELKSWYLEILQADDLSFEKFIHKVKSLSLGGAYRKIIVVPEAVTCKCCCYDNNTLPLVSSDLNTFENSLVEHNQLEAGRRRAVVIEMSLPSSSYATMALRELTRMDTSSEFQTSLNDTKKEDSPIAANEI